MKMDKSYEAFFYSLGVAIIICTLLVSIGKLITYYYFLYIVVCSLLILFSLVIYDYYTYQEVSLRLKEAREVQYLLAASLSTDSTSVRTQVTSKRKTIKTKVGKSHRATTFNGYSSKYSKEPGLRTKSQVHSAMYTHTPKKLQSESCDENDLPKCSPINKRSMKEEQILPTVEENTLIFISREANRSSRMRRRALMSDVYEKEENRCNIQTGKNTLV